MLWQSVIALTDQYLGPADINRILVAIDGSKFAEKAGATAADLASRYSAELVILHVAKYPPNTLGTGSTHTVAVGPPLSDTIVDKEKKNASESMRRVALFAKTLNIDAEEQIIDTSSSIVDVLCDYAYRNVIDLIVLGTRGLNTFKTSSLGSISDGVADSARCAVMIVK